MNRSLLSIILFLSSTLCSHNAFAKSSDETKPIYETRIFTSSECARNGKETIFAAIAGFALEPLLEAGIKSVGNAIKKAGENKETSRTAKETAYFYSIKPGVGAQDGTELNLNLGCITIVDGAKFNSSIETQEKAEEVLVGKYLKKDRRPFFEKDDVVKFLSPKSGVRTPQFSSDIRFYAQYKVEVSNDRTAFRLSPIAVLTGTSFKSKGKEKSRTIDLVINIQLPSSSVEGPSFAVGTSSFKDIKQYKYLNTSESYLQNTSWLPLPPIPSGVTSLIQANEKRRLDLQALRDSLKSSERDVSVPNISLTKKRELEVKLTATKTAISRMETLLNRDVEALGLTTPVTVFASLVETKKGSDFLVKLGELLVENDEAIGKPIFEGLDTNSRATKASEEADAEDMARIAAIEAVLNFNSTSASLTPGGNESGSRVAQIRAQQACRKLRALGHEDVICVGF